MSVTPERTSEEIERVHRIFNANHKRGGLMDAVHLTLHEVDESEGWTMSELMARFLVVRRVD